MSNRRERISFGSATPFYWPGRKIWNWFWDSEYTSIGPPPWAWAIPVVLIAALVAALIALA